MRQKGRMKLLKLLGSSSRSCSRGWTTKAIMIITFALLVGFSGDLAAQTPPIEVDLERCVELALQHNRDILQASLDQRKAQYRTTEARSGLFPRITASGQYLRNIDLPVIFLGEDSPFGGSGVWRTGSKNAYAGGLSLTVPLLSMGLYSGMRSSQRGVELAQIRLESVTEEVIAATQRAYYDVLLLREIRDVSAQRLENARANMENVRRRFDQGTSAEYDLLQAEVRFENVRPEALRAENNLRLGEDALRTTIGLDASVTLRVSGSLTDMAIDAVPDSTAALTRLQSVNANLRLLEKQVELAKEQVTLEKANYWPTLSAFGSYQYQTQANDFEFDDYEWVKTSTVGLVATLPLFEGFRRPARVGQARATLSQSREQQQAVSDRLQVQLQSVLYSITQAKERITVQDKAVSQAQRGYQIAVSRYNNGLGTQLEVNDANLELTRARLNYAQAVYDYLQAMVDYRQLTGALSGSDR